MSSSAQTDRKNGLVLGQRMGRHGSEAIRPARLSCTIRATEEQVSDIAYNVQGEARGYHEKYLLTDGRDGLGTWELAWLAAQNNGQVGHTGSKKVNKLILHYSARLISAALEAAVVSRFSTPYLQQATRRPGSRPQGQAAAKGLRCGRRPRSSRAGREGLPLAQRARPARPLR